MDFQSTQPIYMQVGDYICEKVLRKAWNNGDKIPSVREIAMTTEVNPNTVMRAYAHLQDKGILMNQRGIGYFVSNEAYQKTLELKKEKFIQEELPMIFKTMELLQLSFQDLETFYRQTQTNGHTHETK